MNGYELCTNIMAAQKENSIYARDKNVKSKASKLCSVVALTSTVSD
jgi:hypothetical protein